MHFSTLRQLLAMLSLWLVAESSPHLLSILQASLVCPQSSMNSNASLSSGKLGSKYHVKSTLLPITPPRYHLKVHQAQ